MGRPPPALSADGLLKALGLRAGPNRPLRPQLPPTRCWRKIQPCWNTSAHGRWRLSGCAPNPGLGVGELLAGLTRLELAGQITALAGRRYQRR